MNTAKKKKTADAIQALSADIFYAKIRGDKGIENETEEETVSKSIPIQNAKGIDFDTHQKNTSIEIDTLEQNKGIENETEEETVSKSIPIQNAKGIDFDTHQKNTSIEIDTLGGADYSIGALKLLKERNKGLTALGMLFLLKSLLPEDGGRIKVDYLVSITGMAKSNILAQLEALEIAGIISTIKRDKFGRLINFERMRDY